MFEHLWKAADNFKSETLPQPDSAFVAANNKIELHGAETALPRVFKRMRAHRASYPPADRVRRSHVAAIRNVRAAAFLISLQEVRADDFALVFCDKDLVVRQKPVGECAFPIHVTWERVRFARANDGLQNRPNRIPIACSNRFADQHPDILPRHAALFRLSSLFLRGYFARLVNWKVFRENKLQDLPPSPF